MHHQRVARRETRQEILASPGQLVDRLTSQTGRERVRERRPQVGTTEPHTLDSRAAHRRLEQPARAFYFWQLWHTVLISARPIVAFSGLEPTAFILPTSSPPTGAAVCSHCARADRLGLSSRVATTVHPFSSKACGARIRT
jgi:hypothetical protein